MSGRAGRTVLVVGSGGREHALAWKLSRSARVAQVIVAPGNDGMDPAWERWQAELSTRAGLEALADRARGEEIDLTVVGPDNPLADGIVDLFASRGLAVFGPTAAAARLESSKAFAKEIMQAAGVPTAVHKTATSREEALHFVESAPWPPDAGWGWVVKADGLALGKGVRVCGTLEEARAAIEELFPHSGKLVIEERVRGEELSWLAFCDGERAAPLEPARDYKRLLDEDQGPNTGGMGAFSPVPGIPAAWEERIRKQVFVPVLREMARRGTPFRGMLYAGLMVDLRENQYWVLEFNARFGDPETQALLPRMADDLYDWCEASAHGDLRPMGERVRFTADKAVVVVGAAPGYPERPEKGIELAAPVRDAAQGGLVFYAGVSERDGRLRTSGGRVLGAVGLSENFGNARAQAYQRLKTLAFDRMVFRQDIAEGVRG
jgi:phosphoribosylamine--glycine ligase